MAVIVQGGAVASSRCILSDLQTKCGRQGLVEDENSGSFGLFQVRIHGFANDSTAIASEGIAITSTYAVFVLAKWIMIRGTSSSPDFELIQNDSPQVELENVSKLPRKSLCGQG